jgi:hypothetical protein
MLERVERESVELRGELAGTQAEMSDLRAKLEESVAELGWSKSEGASLRSKLHASGLRISCDFGDATHVVARIGVHLVEHRIRRHGHRREELDAVGLAL